MAVIRTTVRTPGLDAITSSQFYRRPKMRQEISVAWSREYRRFTRSRFYRLSRGGGSWPRLSPRTIRQKKRKYGKNRGIMRASDDMFRSTHPTTKDSNLIQTRLLKTKLKMVATYGGPGVYDSGITHAEVATIHHEGRGRLPRRPIMVQPDRSSKKTLDRDSKRIIVKHMNQAKRRGRRRR